MNKLIIAAALAVGMAAAAEAKVHTYQAVFTDLVDEDGALAALGADTSANELVFTWSFDDAVAPLDGPNSTSTSFSTYDDVFRPYLSFGVTVGGVTINGAPSLSTLDSILIEDGIADGTSDTYDYFDVASFTEQTGPNGVFDLTMYFYSTNSDETIFSGLDHPTEDELNDLSLGDSYAEIFFTKPGGVEAAGLWSETISSYSKIAPVPLPAGLPLLAGGLLCLGLLRRRKAA